MLFIYFKTSNMSVMYTLYVEGCFYSIAAQQRFVVEEITVSVVFSPVTVKKF